MAKNGKELVVEHVSQLKEMLEFCEAEFDLYEDDDKYTIELSSGIRFIFDEDGMLTEIEY